MADLVRSRPETFVGFVAGVPMNDVDAALAEIDRAVLKVITHHAVA
jgi:1,6-anhydro-N-acetylmuramate kinase